MKLDFSNKVCPIPVIETKKALMSLAVGDELEIIVDNEAAKQNIQRLLKENQQDFSLDGFCFKLKVKPFNTTSTNNNTVEEGVFFKSQKIGDGELGAMLSVGFLTALKQRKIKRVILINDAIFMACNEEHMAFNALKELADDGVEILCCANCLNYFNESPKIGRSSNAVEIIDALFNTKIISL